jgi:hypothetical protein
MATKPNRLTRIFVLGLFFLSPWLFGVSKNYFGPFPSAFPQNLTASLRLKNSSAKIRKIGKTVAP